MPYCVKSSAVFSIQNQHTITSVMSDCCAYHYCALRDDRLICLVVKVSASRAEDPRFESRLWQDFSGVESYQ